MAAHFWAIGGATPAGSRLEGRSEFVGYAAGLLSWMISGTAYVAIKWGISEMPPWTFSFGRALISALVLMPIVASHHAEMIAFVRKRWLEAAFIGAIGLGLTQGVLFTALSYTSAVNVGIIFALAPMVTMLMARLILDERMTAGQSAGMLIAFTGIVVISVHGSLALLLGLKFEFGDLLALGAVLLFASYTVLLKRAKFELPPLALLVILLCAGSASALPFFLYEIWSGHHAHLDRTGWLALVYTGTVGGALLYLLYNWSVEVLGASRAGLLIYSQMIFVAFFAWLMLGEAIEWYHFVGAALIIAGVVLVTLLRPKPVASPAR
jgi:drug/metabolite transporter (DMT)-like permease